jgi:CTP:molybdopterin cytidylyltransferase MocA
MAVSRYYSQHYPNQSPLRSRPPALYSGIVNQVSELPMFAVVLAAGTASRFGATKQLREYHGIPLVRRATDLAFELCGEHSILVVGHDWQAVSTACQPLSGFLVVNDHFGDGLSASISQAIRSLRHAANAVIMLLADQPLITAEHLRAMQDIWTGAPNEIVATAFGDTSGPPVLFPRGCFDDLMRLQGDQGARELLHDDRFVVRTVTFEAASIDIDTPQDLKKLI